MDRQRPGVAWVTGAGKGIGRALSLQLAREGWCVAASARTVDDLASLSAEAAGLKGRIVAYPLDVLDAACIPEAVRRVRRELGEIDLAVLNAGTHIPMSAETFDLAAFRHLVEVNLMGTVGCLAALLPCFIARRGGEIAVVSSVAGYSGLPTSAAYGATKAGLINMCEALKPELDKLGVSLRLICPGFVDTPLTRKNDFRMPFMVTLERAANEIIKGLASRRFEIVFPRRMSFAMKLLRLLPYRLFFALTRRVAG